MATVKLTADNVGKYQVSDAKMGAIFAAKEKDEKTQLFTKDAINWTFGTGVVTGVGVVALLAAFDKAPGFTQNKSTRAA